jgi:hypothetical protein
MALAGCGALGCDADAASHPKIALTKVALTKVALTKIALVKIALVGRVHCPRSASGACGGRFSDRGEHVGL